MRAIVGAGIPVVGHVGLTPQSVPRWVAKFRGVTSRGAGVLEDAPPSSNRGLHGRSGGHPKELAEQITSSLPVPTIGIGAGVGCGRQIWSAPTCWA